MNIFKVVLNRNPLRPRLPVCHDFLQIVTFIKCENLEVANSIARDMNKEHRFTGYEIEMLSEEDFLAYVDQFTGFTDS